MRRAMASVVRPQGIRQGRYVFFLTFFLQKFSRDNHQLTHGCVNIDKKTNTAAFFGRFHWGFSSKDIFCLAVSWSGSADTPWVVLTYAKVWYPMSVLDSCLPLMSLRWGGGRGGGVGYIIGTPPNGQKESMKHTCQSLIYVDKTDQLCPAFPDSWWYCFKTIIRSAPGWFKAALCLGGWRHLHIVFWSLGLVKVQVMRLACGDDINLFMFCKIVSTWSQSHRCPDQEGVPPGKDPPVWCYCLAVSLPFPINI